MSTHFLIRPLAALALLALPALAFAAPALPESNTVPTAELTAFYQISPVEAGSNQLAALVALTEVTVANGTLVQTTLNQSADDVVTFTVGQTSLTYNPTTATADVLPNVPGAVYTVTFKRFNGETYTSTVTMPGEIVFTAPTQNQVFQKTDAVTIAWQPPTGAQPVMYMFISDCMGIDFSGLQYNDAGTGATLKAGVAASCKSAVQMEFDPVYATSGNGFGSFTAAAIGALHFSYGATPSPLLHASLVGLRLDRAIARAKMTPDHTLKLQY